MSSDDKPQKISIGFHGGQTLVARVPPGELAKLRESLREERRLARAERR